MRKKKIILLCIICLLTGCGKKEETNKKGREIFTQNVERLIDAIENNKHDINSLETEYIYYNLVSNELVGYYYNNQISNLDYILKYEVSDMNMESIKFVENKIGELYLSIKNNDFCAVKDFKDENFEIYNVNEHEKCNIDLIAEEDVFVEVFGIDMVANKMYVSGNLSNNGLELMASTNILDTTNCSYRWFRNDVEIKNSNVPIYVVNKDENAYYFVEVTTADGKKARSISIHVVISK